MVSVLILLYSSFDQVWFGQRDEILPNTSTANSSRPRLSKELTSTRPSRIWFAKLEGITRNSKPGVRLLFKLLAYTTTLKRGRMEVLAVATVLLFEYTNGNADVSRTGSYKYFCFLTCGFLIIYVSSLFQKRIRLVFLFTFVTYIDQMYSIGIAFSSYFFTISYCDRAVLPRSESRK